MVARPGYLLQVVGLGKEVAIPSPIASASVAPTSVGMFMKTFWLFCVPSCNISSICQCHWQCTQTELCTVGLKTRYRPIQSTKQQDPHCKLLCSRGERGTSLISSVA